MKPLFRSLAKINFLGFVVASLVMAQSAQADTGTWTGAVSGSWTSLSNWSLIAGGTAVPGASQNAYFIDGGNGNTNIVTHPTTRLQIGSIYFDTANCASYTITSDRSDKSLQLSTTNGGITINAAVTTDQTFNANFITGNGTHFNNNGTGTLYINGSVIASTSGSNTSNTIGGSGRVVFSGSIENTTGGFARNFQKTGTGKVTIDGNNTYTGTTKISGGVLFLNGDNSAATGAVNVVGSGTGANTLGAFLSGTGIIGGATLVGGTTTASTSTLSAGTETNDIGKLTFLSTLTLTSSYSNTIFQIDGAVRGVSYDAIDLGADQLLTYGGKLTLDIGNTLAAGNYDLFNFTGGYSAGDYTSIAVTGGLYDGYTFSETLAGSGIWVAGQGAETMTFDTSTGDLMVVPEPQSLALVGVGIASLLTIARRRRLWA